MPGKVDEAKWEEAKKQAAKQGKKDNYAYIMGIYKNMIGDSEYSRKLQGKLEWNGIKISIENKKGSVRSGVDRDGTPWETKMNYDYGRIPRTMGNDGDSLDVYIGPDLDSELVFIVHQRDPWKNRYDEDKCMIGFRTRKQAEKAFLSQYNRPDFLGPIDTVSVNVFKEILKSPMGKEQGPIGSRVVDADILTEALLTPIIKRIMRQFGFSRMRWIGHGWIVPIGAEKRLELLGKMSILKTFSEPIKKLGYQIRISPIGFYIEPVNGKGE